MVAEIGAAAVTLTDAGIEHVGKICAPAGMLESVHVNVTGPVNPPCGVSVTVDVFPVVAPGDEIMTGVPLRANGLTTVTGMVMLVCA